MGGDHGNYTAGSEDESLPTRLLDRICRFILDLALISIDQRVLPDATAHHSCEKILCLGKGRECFAVVPIDNLKFKRIKQREGNVMAM